MMILYIVIILSLLLYFNIIAKIIVADITTRMTIDKITNRIIQMLEDSKLVCLVEMVDTVGAFDSTVVFNMSELGNSDSGDVISGGKQSPNAVNRVSADLH